MRMACNPSSVTDSETRSGNRSYTSWANLSVYVMVLSVPVPALNELSAIKAKTHALALAGPGDISDNSWL